MREKRKRTTMENIRPKIIVILLLFVAAMIIWDKQRAKESIRYVITHNPQLMKQVAKEKMFKNAPELQIDDDNYAAKVRERAENFDSTTELGRFLEEQKERIEKVAKLKSKFSNNAESVPAAQNTHLITHREKFLTFCPIDKVATTAWFTSMYGITKVQANQRKEMKKRFYMVSLDERHDTFFKNLPRNYMVDDEMAALLLTPKDRLRMYKAAIKLIVVRHPLERFVDVYESAFKLARNRPYYHKYGGKMVQKYRPVPEGIDKSKLKVLMNDAARVVNKWEKSPATNNFYADPIGPTFEEFAKFVIETEQSDRIWQPAYLQCSADNLDYDIVLKYEHLDVEGGAFLSYMGMANEIPENWKGLEKPKDARNNLCEYFEELPSDIMDKLVEYYRSDFELYDYSYDEYLKCGKGATKVGKEP